MLPRHLRRLASIKCPVPSCSKFLKSQGGLKKHLRAKHPRSMHQQVHIPPPDFINQVPEIAMESSPELDRSLSPEIPQFLASPDPMHGALPSSRAQTSPSSAGVAGGNPVSADQGRPIF